MPLSTCVLTRRSLTLLGVCAALSALPIAATTAAAYDEASTSAVNVDKAGVGLHGYDPVAYFTEGKPTAGQPQYSTKHEDVTYYFASASNRDAFLREPSKYTPQFGGFCAMGVVMDKKLDGDPKLWKIVDGRLYLNVSEAAAKRWQEDIPGNIAKADQNWPKIQDKAPKDL